MIRDEKGISSFVRVMLEAYTSIMYQAHKTILRNSNGVLAFAYFLCASIRVISIDIGII
jgi:hypothetical protein